MSCQGHRSLYPAAVHFIINHCLADEGRVQVKNIQNVQTEGIRRPGWTPSHSQQTINILMAADLAAPQFSLPCWLQKYSQDFLPRKSTRHGKNRRWTHSLLSTLEGLMSNLHLVHPWLLILQNFKSQFEAADKLYSINMYSTAGRGRKGKKPTLPFSLKTITEPQSLFGF